jgi:hypothetical protein
VAPDFAGNSPRKARGGQPPRKEAMLLRYGVSIVAASLIWSVRSQSGAPATTRDNGDWLRSEASIATMIEYEFSSRQLDSHYGVATHCAS